MVPIFAVVPYLSYFLLPSVMRTASPKLAPQKVPKRAWQNKRGYSLRSWERLRLSSPIGCAWTELSQRRSHAAQQVKSSIWSPKGYFLRAKPWLHYRWEYARAYARLYKRTAKPSWTKWITLPYRQNYSASLHEIASLSSVQAKPIGGARLFCQALFGTFWGAKKYERTGNTMQKRTIPYAECRLDTTWLLSNNFGDKKHIV